MSSGCGPHGDGLSCGESVEDSAVHLDGASDLEVVHRRCGAGAVGEDRDALALHLPLLDRAQQRVEVDVARGGVGGADALRQPRRGAALRLIPAHATSTLSHRRDGYARVAGEKAWLTDSSARSLRPNLVPVLFSCTSSVFMNARLHRYVDVQWFCGSAQRQRHQTDNIRGE